VADKSSRENFINQDIIAVVGVSRNKNKYGSIVYRDLKEKGFQLYPINPNMDEFDGETCYPDLQSLPVKVGGVVIIVPPEKTVNIVHQAKEAGISNIWMQPGAESTDAIEYCWEFDINCMSGECIMMATQQV
jgi:predicted CoA-binding protein